MSLQLRFLNFGLRWGVKPYLARLGTPSKARKEFEVAAPILFPLPAGACHLVRPLADMSSHWYRCGKARDGKIILYLHGGAYMAGSGRTHGRLATLLARHSGIEVCVPNYRLLQQAAFPAAFDDAVAAWNALLVKGYAPKDIALAGDSAGGGLAFALLSYLLQKGERPAGLVAFSPWNDLTLSGASLLKNQRKDPLLPASRIEEARDYYVQDAEPSDPRCSPLFAPFPDAPPILIHVGSTEILLDDSYRIEAALRQSGADVTL